MVKRVVPGLVGLLVAIAIVVWFVLPRPAVDPLSWSGGTDSSAVPPISGTVRNFTPTNPRRPAPIDTFHDANGNEFNLQSFGDKVVLLNLWATWCAPCIKELPSLDRLQAQLGSDRFEVVAVSVDRRGVDAVRPFFEKLKISHLAIYAEPKNHLAQSIGLEVLPSTIIIGPHGLMAGKLIGAAEWDAPEALALVRHYIDQANTVTQN